MLHEVLFALAGHSGGVFIDKGDGIQVLFYDIIHTKTTVPLHRWPWTWYCPIGMIVKMNINF